MPEKLSYQEVFNYIQSQNHQLLSKEYVNSYTKLKIRCPKEHIFEMNYHNFKNRRRCSKCAGNKKYTYQEVYNYIKSQGYQLLSNEYKNISTKLIILCPKGHIFKMNFSVFKNQGSRCSNKNCVKEKMIKTFQQNYGVEWPSQLDIIKNKKIKTCLQNHGVEWPSQNEIIHKKQQKYKWKSFILPSGRIINIQGNEDKALNYLLKNIYSENEIKIHKGVPSIWYSQNNKKHRYYPDFYIPKENLIVEVKSKYTWNYNLEKNLLKIKATTDSGYKFQLIIIN